MTSFAFRPSTETGHSYFVLLHTVDAPDAATWNQYVGALAAVIAQSKTAVQVFAATDGGGPGPGQRRALAAVFAQDQRGAITHVFTTSTVTRGIVTAFHWVARTRAVAHLPSDFPAICARCRIPARAVFNDLLRLQALLPPVALLRDIERAVHGMNGSQHSG
jgi:hypothetical protein